MDQKRGEFMRRKKTILNEHKYNSEPVKPQNFTEADPITGFMMESADESFENDIVKPNEPEPDNSQSIINKPAVAAVALIAAAVIGFAVLVYIK